MNTDKRTSLVRKNIIMSIFVKGWAMLVQLLLVPLTLACLDVYENGIWLTISSVLLWIDNFDVGLGNGLRNKLATYLAVGDIKKSRELVSSTLAMQALIIVPVCFGLVMAECHCNVYGALNVDVSRINNLQQVIIVSTILVCSTFILKFIGNFYMGLQMPAISNAIVTAGNTFALLGTVLVYLSGKHSLFLVALANTLGPFLAYTLCFPLTFYGKYSYLRPTFRMVKMSAIKELLSIGTKFFVLQIAGIVLFFSTNIIISQFFTPSMVTPYQIAYRYFMVAMLLFTIICVPYWSATTDAYVRKDFDWISRANITLNRYMMFIFLLIAIMIFISPIVYNIWIGDKASVPFGMTVLVGVYVFILIMSTRYSYILNGIGKLKLQFYITLLMAIIYIPIIIVVKEYNDINILLLVMCVINLPGLIFNVAQYNKIIKGTAKGIWAK